MCVCVCVCAGHLWSAPEVVTGRIYSQDQTNKTALWQKADMWSFGVILHEIVNRKKPFPSFYDSDAEGKSMIAHSIPLPQSPLAYL